MDVTVSRPAYLQALQALHPEGPVVSRDQVQWRFTRRLIDGTPFPFVFVAHAIGD